MGGGDRRQVARPGGRDAGTGLRALLAAIRQITGQGRRDPLGRVRLVVTAEGIPAGLELRLAGVEGALAQRTLAIGLPHGRGTRFGEERAKHA